MKMQDCPRFISCSAPICPLSKKSKNNCAWYPNEEICKRPVIRKKYKFTKIQMRIKNKTKKFESGSFDVEMLNRLKRITSKVSGLDDIKKLKKYNTWIKCHPINDVYSEAVEKRKKAAIETLNKYRMEHKKVTS